MNCILSLATLIGIIIVGLFLAGLALIVVFTAVAFVNELVKSFKNRNK